MSTGRGWQVFEFIRRVVIFGLGVWIIAAALSDAESQNTISMLVIGMVMVGVMPIENLFIPWIRRSNGAALGPPARGRGTDPPAP